MSAQPPIHPSTVKLEIPIKYEHDVPYPEYGILTDGKDIHFMPQIEGDRGAEIVYSGWLKIALTPSSTPSTSLTLSQMYDHLTSTLTAPPGIAQLSRPDELVKYIDSDAALASCLRVVEKGKEDASEGSPDVVDEQVVSDAASTGLSSSGKESKLDITSTTTASPPSVLLTLPSTHSTHPHNPTSPLTPPATANLLHKRETSLIGYELRDPTFEEVSEIWRGVGMSFFRWGLGIVEEMRESGLEEEQKETAQQMDMDLPEEPGNAADGFEETVARKEAASSGASIGMYEIDLAPQLVRAVRKGGTESHAETPHGTTNLLSPRRTSPAASKITLKLSSSLEPKAPQSTVPAPPSSTTASPTTATAPLVTKPPLAPPPPFLLPAPIFYLPDSAFILHDNTKLPYPEVTVRKFFPLPGLESVKSEGGYTVQQNSVAGPSRMTIESLATTSVPLSGSTSGGVVCEPTAKKEETEELPKRALKAAQVVGVEGSRRTANAWLSHMLTPDDPARPRFTYISSVYEVYRSYAYHPPGCPVLEYEDFVAVVRGKEGLVGRKDRSEWPGDELDRGFYEVTTEVGDWAPGGNERLRDPGSTVLPTGGPSTPALFVRASLQADSKMMKKAHEAIWYAVGMSWQKAKAFDWDPVKITDAAARKAAEAKKRQEEAGVRRAQRVQAKRQSLVVTQARRGSGAPEGIAKISGVVGKGRPADINVGSVNVTRIERPLPYTPEATDIGDGNSDIKAPQARRGSWGSSGAGHDKQTAKQAGPGSAEWAKTFAGDFVRMWLRDVYNGAPRGQVVPQKVIWAAFSDIVRRELDHYDRQMAIFQAMRYDQEKEPSAAGSYEQFLERQNRFRSQLEQHHAIICNYLGAQPGDLFRMVVDLFGASLAKGQGGEFVIDGLAHAKTKTGRQLEPMGSGGGTNQAETPPLSDTRAAEQRRPLGSHVVQQATLHRPIHQPSHYVHDVPFHLPQPQPLRHHSLSNGGHAPASERRMYAPS